MRHSSVRLVVPCLVACAFIALSALTMSGLTSHPQKISAATSPVRIMPLGDSITGSPGCWRALLWNQLQTAGFTNIDFVGTLPPQGCGIAYDGDNEGHGGILATNMANQNQLPAWLSATNPNIVLMHLGTNDVWSHLSNSTILAAYSTLVDQMRANNPNMKILVAQIIPMNPSSCTDCAQGVVSLNAAIPAWASSKSTAQSPIIVVDQWTGFDDSTDTVDGVHPNDSGNQKMAGRWFPPLSAQLTVTSTPGATPTPGITPTPTRVPTQGVTPTPARTPTPGTTATASSGPCRVTYTITNQWPGGFGTNIAITNTGSTAITSWSLQFTFANGQTITQLWNGSFTQSGANVTITNASYNASIAPGATLASAPGFNGSWNGSNAVPASFTLNGATCTKG
ncbi:MAG TPA: cellulose binding domain-containing protein [Ktedonobacteraceae bacterium]|nr:cellulose binding domain-containing protein [Ktedonobacteraceae bacterium]